MKHSSDLWDTASLYICELHNWRCYFFGLIKHNCGGPMQACHIIPKGKTRIGERLRYDEQNLVCGCKNINWWMSAYPQNQQIAEMAVERSDPQRWAYLQKVKSDIAQYGGPTRRKAGGQRVLMTYCRQKLDELMERHRDEGIRDFQSFDLVEPFETGAGFVTQLEDGRYCRNTWNGKRWKIDGVVLWDKVV